MIEFFKQVLYFIFILVCIFNITLSSVEPHRLALGSQGKADIMLQWISMYSNMNSSTHTTLFVLTYDKPLTDDNCLVHGVQCIYHPQSTWTSGRNHILRAMKQLETHNGNLFKYYAFADDDLVNADCHKDTGCDDVINKNSCCFDSISYFLLSNMDYAVVNFVSLGGVAGTGGISKISHWDCSDGAFNAYHRAAVPVLLPYVELVDRYSWWGSQAIMWTVIGGCVPGYSIFVGVFNIIRTSGHASYPRGRYEEVEIDAKQAVYARKGLSPWPIDIHAVRTQGDCMKLGLPVKKIHQAAWKSGDWLKKEEFLKCYIELKPRLDSFISSGNLSKTDFIDFGPYKTTL